MNSKRYERGEQLRHRLLLQLADGEFHSGEALGRQFSVTRANISQHIKLLQNLGLDIFCVTGKGYRLAKPLNLLNKQTIANTCQYVPSEQIHIFDSIDSTNAWILRETEQLDNGSICLAETQTAGRGRRGRQWVSPLASHLYYSMYWQLPGGISQTMGLSLVVGVAIVETLRQLNVLDSGLKWPNDVYLQGKKLAGVLVEMTGQTDGPCDLVIGIGININMPKQSGEQIDQPWIDLNTVSETPIDRNKLAGLLTTNLVATLQEFQQQGFSIFQQRWNQADVFANRRVQLSAGQQVFNGICRGVDHNGAIQLAVDGMVQSYFGGELSLKLVE